MDNKYISDLKSLLIEMDSILGHLGEIVIAGGSVRDALMDKSPKDIDLFILSSKKEQEIKQAIANHLSKFTVVKPIVEWHKSEPFLLFSFLHPLYGEIQIMFRENFDVEQLLDTFDWNVSLFALTKDKLYNREKIENIAPGQELKLQKITFPKSTLRRGFRFSERFFMKFPNQTLIEICNLISQQEQEKQEKQKEKEILLYV